MAEDELGARLRDRAFVERMQEGAVTLTQEGTVLYSNQSFAALARVSSEKLVGHSIFRFFHAAGAVALRTLFVEAAAGVAARELDLLAEDGASVPVNVSLTELNGQGGSPALICGVFTDLSPVHQSNDQLRTLQIALDAAGMGSWELCLRTGDVQRSLRHDEIFGERTLLADWTLQQTLERIVAEDRPLVARAFAQAELSGSIDLEARIHRGANDLRWIHLHGRTFYEAGIAVRLIGVIADVTERRAVEDRLRLAQKIEALGQLTGGVAHDFNNLLQVVSSGLQILGRPLDVQHRDRIFGSMKHAVDRGARLCRQLLAFSRRQTLKPEPIDLRRLIGGMRELLSRSLRGDVEVRTQFAQRLWPVEVDSGELELVVLNLAVNARDAMPTGGTIDINGSNVTLTEQDLSGDFVRLDIVDTGIGMSAETLAHAFEPFFTTKGVGMGSGLGLAQAHGFARASRGVARIESAEGQGTTVSLFLPRTLRVPPQPDESAAALETPAVTSGQVLLVEDDDEVAALTEEMINQLGYDTTRVASAEAALGALADRRAVDIVFSDVMMPGRMNGVELAQEIRRRRPNVAILLTSGYAESASRSAAAHQIKIIPKPYRIDQLRDALAAARQDARNAD
jgi:PAS domain S-box-containing protein